MRGVVITTAGDVRVEDKKWKLKDLQEVVGGFVEMVIIYHEREPKAAMWVNEEGKLNNLPWNEKATWLAEDSKLLIAGDYIVGNVVVLGLSKDGEDSSDCPDWVERRIKEIGEES